MLPHEYQRFFWDVDFAALDRSAHQRYIIERLLEVGDLPALRWLLTSYASPDIIDVIKHTRSLSPRSATLWALYFNLNPTEVPCIQKSWRAPRNIEPCMMNDEVEATNLQDLACMKLEAIASRGKKRDFIDVHALTQRGNSLQQMVSWFEKKYQGLQYNLAHLIKSLVYFQDAENDPMPVMLQPADWSQVKGFFQREVRTLLP